MRRKSSVSARAERLLDLPTGSLATTVRIELMGDRRVLIEGCEGIVRYDEDRIQIRTVDGVVRFTGRGLCMTNLNPACSVITGRILSLEFL